MAYSLYKESAPSTTTIRVNIKVKNSFNQKSPDNTVWTLGNDMF